MQYEDILKRIGEWGKYQKLLLLALAMIQVPVACQYIGQVFWAPNVDHWCKVRDSVTINCSQVDWVDECYEEQKAGYIPYEVDEDGGRIYSSCERFVALEGEVDSGQELNASSDTIHCDAGWDFDRSRYKSTVSEDFNLVCDRKYLAGVAQSVWFAGVLTGSLVWGSVGDWIGRRRTFMCCVILASISSIATSFVQSFEAFVVMRFVTGANSYGSVLISFVLATELVGPQERVMVASAFTMCFSFGYVVLSMMAFLLREWRHLQLAGSVPFVLYFALFCAYPESPRWLITKGKLKEATQILERISKVNGTEVPENIFDTEEGSEVRRPSMRVTPRDLVVTPNLRKITTIISFDFFVVSMAYYGLSLSTSSLGIDDYLAAFVSASVEIPGVLVGWYVMERFGRRLTFAVFYVSGGLSCLITTLLPLGVARAAVAMLGKFAITAAFNQVYVYAGELYPTVARSTGVGVSSMVGSISGILCPIILILGKFWEPLPLIVFGGTSLIAGTVSLMLPETLGRNLPETIAEGEISGESPGLRLCCKANPNHGIDNATPMDYKPCSTTDKDTKHTPTNGFLDI